MGRPINKNYIGNTTGTGTQIQAKAFIPNDPLATNAWISSQKATSAYRMSNVFGVTSGICELVNGGVALTAGQANITVTPYGSTGSGATANSNIGISTVSIGVAGTGTYASYFVPGQILTTTAGTATAKGNVIVDSVKSGTANILVNANGYTVGDTFTWAYAGFDTAPVITVATTTANGNIATVTITNAGSVSNLNITNTVQYSSSTKTNAWATGATFRVRWDLNEISIVNTGDYSSAPANNVALSGGTGTGATAVMSWEVSSIQVLNGGSGYSAVSVGFGSGTAAALGTVNAAGSLTSVAITAAGGPYSNTAPTVTISKLGTVQYAKVIKNRTVTTFSGNTYEWVFTGTTMTASNQAQLQGA